MGRTDDDGRELPKEGALNSQSMDLPRGTGTRYALTKLFYCTEPFDDASSHSGWVPFRNTSKHSVDCLFFIIIHHCLISTE